MKRCIPAIFFTIALIAVLVYSLTAERDVSTLILFCGILAAGGTVVIFQFFEDAGRSDRERAEQRFDKILSTFRDSGNVSLENLKKELELLHEKTAGTVPAGTSDDKADEIKEILENKLGALDEKINALDERLDAIDERLAHIEQAAAKSKKQILDAIDAIETYEEGEFDDEAEAEEETENDGGNEDDGQNVPAEPETESTDDEEEEDEEEKEESDETEESGGNDEPDEVPEPASVPAATPEEEENLDLPHAILTLTAELSTTEPPQLSGNAPLSQTERVSMDYSGGNRWRYDFGQIRQPVVFTIYKFNSNTALGESITIRPASQLKLKWTP